MPGRKIKLLPDELEWARARYQERMATLTTREIARRIGVSQTTLYLSLFPERRHRIKALRILNTKPVRRRVAKQQEGAPA